MSASPIKQSKSTMYPLIEQCLSGQSDIASICKSHHISRKVYHYWLRKYNAEQSPCSNFIPIGPSVHGGSDPWGAAFAEVVLPNLTRVRLLQPVPASFIQAILKPCCR